MGTKKDFKEIFRDVYGPFGYATSSLTETDLSELRSIVNDHYRGVLSSIPELGNFDWDNIEMDKYHQFSHLIDHGKIWSKIARILPLDLYNRVMELSLFKELKDELGALVISDEENIGYPEIYWRLVRPLPHKDVGPIHADAWFWELGHGFTPETHHRIKFWFSLHNESGQNGFCFVPSSHLKDYPYQSEERHGSLKPVFNDKEFDLDIQTFKSNPGDFIVFNDRLLHGGKAGGSTTRVSIEFTLFVPLAYLSEIGVAK